MSSLGIRNYLITHDDEILRISNKKLDRVITGSQNDQLKVCGGKKVRAAEIVVKIVDRRPVEVVRAAYRYLHFDKDGNLDQEQYKDDRIVSIEAGLPEFLAGSSDGNILYARQKFAMRKRDNSVWWKPNSKLECKIFDIAIEDIKCKSL